MRLLEASKHGGSRVGYATLYVSAKGFNVATSSSEVFEGWAGYQASLVHSVEALTREQLAWRPAAGKSSVGEAVAHIAFGRIGWFHNMGAPGAAELAGKAAEARDKGSIAEDARLLVEWLEASWSMVYGTLKAWTVDNLRTTYRHEYWGRTYAVSRQWTIFRILAHDIHHGGQLTVMLGMQGIEPSELTGFGGHLTEPPLWNAEASPEPPLEAR
jgi:uncharacterized damage-inducible protein DinB